MAHKTHEKLIPPIHPGEIVKEDFMKELGLSATKLASMLDVLANRITEIINGERAITADTAVRLAACFKVSPEFWLNLQRDYDLRVLEQSRAKEIRETVRPAKAATTRHG
jgi:addiction module HigA family antidote